MWTNIANWSTPTILFCVLNLMIAIIFIASNFSNNHHHGNSPRQLTPRSPSMLERVKSVNLSSFYSTTTTTQDSHDHYIGDHYQPMEDSSVNQLSRGSSLLQRVKSINLSFSTSSSTLPIESEQVNSASELTDSEQVNITKELTRAPSFLDRVKSFKLTSPFKSDSPPDDTFTRQDEHLDVPPDHDVVEDHNVTSDNSRYNKLSNVSGKYGMNLTKRSTSHLSKSSSEKRVVESDHDEEDVDRRRPATMRELVGVKDECVNAKADDFIKRFKQQLKLQRLDSLQRFRDMLNRGT
ncbi:hypothetical protein CTI12_AA598470 [Artemisia annua]|uniref:DUF4408 domain-containing protein n=1 Tax=Artemisia annua TaxID=35608 RepID=A0A2U1KII5_ARTAN|nr:hypothetical protein CTI12_AA598470 [Artemisia annua]